MLIVGVNEVTESRQNTKKRNMIVIIVLYVNITDTEKELVVCTISK